ncbi:MAG: hypothetical protein MJ252_22570 [archaeon]|nr:hypothetical protein [archaeon]
MLSLVMIISKAFFLFLFLLLLKDSLQVDLNYIKTLGCKDASCSECKEGYIKGETEIEVLGLKTYCHLPHQNYKTHSCDETQCEIKDSFCPGKILMPFKICIDKCQSDSNVNVEQDGKALKLYEFQRFCYFECPSALTKSKGSSCAPNLDIASTTNSSIGPIYVYNSQSTSSYFSKNYLEAAHFGRSVIGMNEIFLLVSDQFNFFFFKYGLEKTKEGKELMELAETPNVFYEEGCLNSLRGNTKNFSPGDDFYLGVLVLNNKTTSIANETRHVLFDWAGNEIDISVCESSVRIQKKFDQKSDLIDFSIVKDLEAQGLDIFDTDNPAFTDNCIPLAIAGKDTTVEIRQERILSKIVLCEEDCPKESLDYPTSTVTCKCETKNLNGLSKKVKTEEEAFDIMGELLEGANIKLFNCYETAFKWIYLHNNYSFWVNSTFYALDVFFCILYCMSYHDPLIMHMAHEFKKYFPNALIPPKKKRQAEEKSQSSSLRQIGISKDQETNQKLKFKDISEENSMEKIPEEKAKNAKTVKNGKTRVQEIKDDLKLDEKEEVYAEEVNLNDLPFEQAIEQDERKFCGVLFELMCEKVDILSAIFTRSVFYPFPLRMMVIFFIFICFFFSNALFLSEDIIKTIYEEVGGSGFLNLIISNFSITIESACVMVIASKFFSLLLSVGETFDYFMRTRLEKKEEIKKQERKKEMIKRIKELRKEILTIYKTRKAKQLFSEETNYINDIENNNNISLESEDEEANSKKYNARKYFEKTYNTKDFEDACRLRELIKGVKIKFGICFFIIIVLGGLFLFFLMAFGNVYENLQWLWICLVIIGIVLNVLIYLGLCLFITVFRFIGLKKHSE